MILVVDSGNTLIKWGIYDYPIWVAKGSLSHTEHYSLFNSLKTYDCISQVLVSNVAGIDAKNKLTNLFSDLDLEPFWVHPCKLLCGLHNKYNHCNSLGSDRWSSMIAAWDLYHEPCMVVSAGTALTIDMISDRGEFFGGIICPGYHSLRNSLFTIPSLSNISNGLFEKAPLSSENALYSGVINMLVGAIERIYNVMSCRHNKFHCIISGGDSSLLLPYLDSKFIKVENLVLDGLVIIAREI